MSARRKKSGKTTLNSGGWAAPPIALAGALAADRFFPPEEETEFENTVVAVSAIANLADYAPLSDNFLFRFKAEGDPGDRPLPNIQLASLDLTGKTVGVETLKESEQLLLDLAQVDQRWSGFLEDLNGLPLLQTISDDLELTGDELSRDGVDDGSDDETRNSKSEQENERDPTSGETTKVEEETDSSVFDGSGWLFGLLGGVGGLSLLGGGGVVAVLSGAVGGGSSKSGKIIDPYVSGATVFLDENANLTLDAGEISTTSALDGSYTLPNIGGRTGNIVAMGGTDTDTGVEMGYLQAPLDFDVVSPISSLVAGGLDISAILGSGVNAEDYYSFDPVATLSAGESEQAKTFLATGQRALAVVRSTEAILGSAGSVDAATAFSNAVDGLKAVNDFTKLKTGDTSVIKNAIQRSLSSASIDFDADLLTATASSLGAAVEKIKDATVTDVSSLQYVRLTQSTFLEDLRNTAKDAASGSDITALKTALENKYATAIENAVAEDAIAIQSVMANKSADAPVRLVKDKLTTNPLELTNSGSDDLQYWHEPIIFDVLANDTNNTSGELKILSVRRAGDKYEEWSLGLSELALDLEAVLESVLEEDQTIFDLDLSASFEIAGTQIVTDVFNFSSLETRGQIIELAAALRSALTEEVANDIYIYADLAGGGTDLNFVSREVGNLTNNKISSFSLNYDGGSLSDYTFNVTDGSKNTDGNTGAAKSRGFVRENYETEDGEVRDVIEFFTYDKDAAGDSQTPEYGRQTLFYAATSTENPDQVSEGLATIYVTIPEVSLSDNFYVDVTDAEGNFTLDEDGNRETAAISLSHIGEAHSGRVHSEFKYNLPSQENENVLEIMGIEDQTLFIPLNIDYDFSSLVLRNIPASWSLTFGNLAQNQISTVKSIYDTVDIAPLDNWSDAKLLHNEESGAFSLDLSDLGIKENSTPTYEWVYNDEVIEGANAASYDPSNSGLDNKLLTVEVKYETEFVHHVLHVNKLNEYIADNGTTYLGLVAAEDFAGNPYTDSDRGPSIRGFNQYGSVRSDDAQKLSFNIKPLLDGFDADNLQDFSTFSLGVDGTKQTSKAKEDREFNLGDELNRANVAAYETDIGRNLADRDGSESYGFIVRPSEATAGLIKSFSIDEETLGDRNFHIQGKTLLVASAPEDLENAGALQAALDSITLGTDNNFSGNISISVSAFAYEKVLVEGDFSAVAEGQLFDVLAPENFTIKVAPVADKPGFAIGIDERFLDENGEISQTDGRFDVTLKYDLLTSDPDEEYYLEVSLDDIRKISEFAQLELRDPSIKTSTITDQDGTWIRFAKHQYLDQTDAGVQDPADFQESGYIFGIKAPDTASAKYGVRVRGISKDALSDGTAATETYDLATVDIAFPEVPRAPTLSVSTEEVTLSEDKAFLLSEIISLSPALGRTLSSVGVEISIKDPAFADATIVYTKDAEETSVNSSIVEGEVVFRVDLDSIQTSDVKLVPPENFSGAVSLSVIATDRVSSTGDEASTSPLSFSIDIQPVPDQPKVDALVESLDIDVGVDFSISGLLKTITSPDPNETVRISILGEPPNTFITPDTSNGGYKADISRLSFQEGSTPVYQWSYDGTVIEGAVAATYTPSKEQPNNELLGLKVFYKDTLAQDAVADGHLFQGIDGVKVKINDIPAVRVGDGYNITQSDIDTKEVEIFVDPASLPPHEAAAGQKNIKLSVTTIDSGTSNSSPTEVPLKLNLNFDALPPEASVRDVMGAEDTAILFPLDISIPEERQDFERFGFEVTVPDDQDGFAFSVSYRGNNVQADIVEVTPGTNVIEILGKAGETFKDGAVDLAALKLLPPANASGSFDFAIKVFSETVSDPGVRVYVTEDGGTKPRIFDLGVQVDPATETFRWTNNTPNKTVSLTEDSAIDPLTVPVEIQVVDLKGGGEKVFSSLSTTTAFDSNEYSYLLFEAVPDELSIVGAEKLSSNASGSTYKLDLLPNNNLTNFEFQLEVKDHYSGNLTGEQAIQLTLYSTESSGAQFVLGSGGENDQKFSLGLNIAGVADKPLQAGILNPSVFLKEDAADDVYLKLSDYISFGDSLLVDKDGSETALLKLAITHDGSISEDIRFFTSSNESSYNLFDIGSGISASQFDKIYFRTAGEEGAETHANGSYILDFNVRSVEKLGGSTADAAGQNIKIQVTPVADGVKTGLSSLTAAKTVNEGNGSTLLSLFKGNTIAQLETALKHDAAEELYFRFKFENTLELSTSSANVTIPKATADGSKLIYLIPAEDLGSINIAAKGEDASGIFNISLEALTREQATGAMSVASASETVSFNISPVADTPIFSAPQNLEFVIVDGTGAQIAKPVPMQLAATDDDGSEAASLTIHDVPSGIDFYLDGEKLVKSSFTVDGKSTSGYELTESGVLSKLATLTVKSEKDFRGENAATVKVMANIVDTAGKITDTLDQPMSQTITIKAYKPVETPRITVPDSVSPVSTKGEVDISITVPNKPAGASLSALITNVPDKGFFLIKTDGDSSSTVQVGTLIESGIWLFREDELPSNTKSLSLTVPAEETLGGKDVELEITAFAVDPESGTSSSSSTNYPGMRYGEVGASDFSDPVVISFDGSQVIASNKDVYPVSFDITGDGEANNVFSWMSGTGSSWEDAAGYGFLTKSTDVNGINDLFTSFAEVAGWIASGNSYADARLWLDSANLGAVDDGELIALPADFALNLPANQWTGGNAGEPLVITFEEAPISIGGSVDTARAFAVGLPFSHDPGTGELSSTAETVGTYTYSTPALAMNVVGKESGFYFEDIAGGVSYAYSVKKSTHDIPSGAIANELYFLKIQLSDGEGSEIRPSQDGSTTEIVEIVGATFVESAEGGAGYWLVILEDDEGATQIDGRFQLSLPEHFSGDVSVDVTPAVSFTVNTIHPTVPAVFESFTTEGKSSEQAVNVDAVADTPILTVLKNSIAASEDDPEGISLFEIVDSGKEFLFEIAQFDNNEKLFFDLKLEASSSLEISGESLVNKGDNVFRFAAESPEKVDDVLEQIQITALEHFSGIETIAVRAGTTEGTSEALTDFQNITLEISGVADPVKDSSNLAVNGKAVESAGVEIPEGGVISISGISVIAVDSGETVYFEFAFKDIADPVHGNPIAEVRGAEIVSTSGGFSTYRVAGKLGETDGTIVPLNQVDLVVNPFFDGELEFKIEAVSEESQSGDQARTVIGGGNDGFNTVSIVPVANSFSLSETNADFVPLLFEDNQWRELSDGAWKPNASLENTQRYFGLNASLVDADEEVFIEIDANETLFGSFALDIFGADDLTTAIGTFDFGNSAPYSSQASEIDLGNLRFSLKPIDTSTSQNLQAPELTFKVYSKDGEVVSNAQEINVVYELVNTATTPVISNSITEVTVLSLEDGESLKLFDEGPLGLEPLGLKAPGETRGLEFKGIEDAGNLNISNSVAVNDGGKIWYRILEKDLENLEILTKEQFLTAAQSHELTYRAFSLDPSSGLIAYSDAQNHVLKVEITPKSKTPSLSYSGERVSSINEDSSDHTPLSGLSGYVYSEEDSEAVRDTIESFISLSVFNEDGKQITLDVASKMGSAEAYTLNTETNEFEPGASTDAATFYRFADIAALQSLDLSPTGLGLPQHQKGKIEVQAAARQAFYDNEGSLIKASEASEVQKVIREITPIVDKVQLEVNPALEDVNEGESFSVNKILSTISQEDAGEVLTLQLAIPSDVTVSRNENILDPMAVEGKVAYYSMENNDFSALVSGDQVLNNLKVSADRYFSGSVDFSLQATTYEPEGDINQTFSRKQDFSIDFKPKADGLNFSFATAEKQIQEGEGLSFSANARADDPDEVITSRFSLFETGQYYLAPELIVGSSKSGLKIIDTGLAETEERRLFFTLDDENPEIFPVELSYVPVSSSGPLSVDVTVGEHSFSVDIEVTVSTDGKFVVSETQIKTIMSALAEATLSDGVSDSFKSADIPTLTGAMIGDAIVTGVGAHQIDLSGSLSLMAGTVVENFAINLAENQFKLGLGDENISIAAGGREFEYTSEARNFSSDFTLSTGTSASMGQFALVGRSFTTEENVKLGEEAWIYDAIAVSVIDKTHGPDDYGVQERLTQQEDFGRGGVTVYAAVPGEVPGSIDFSSGLVGFSIDPEESKYIKFSVDPSEIFVLVTINGREIEITPTSFRKDEDGLFIRDSVNNLSFIDEADPGLSGMYVQFDGQAFSYVFDELSSNEAGSLFSPGGVTKIELVGADNFNGQANVAISAASKDGGDVKIAAVVNSQGFEISDDALLSVQVTRETGETLTFGLKSESTEPYVDAIANRTEYKIIGIPETWGDVTFQWLLDGEQLSGATEDTVKKLNSSPFTSFDLDIEPVTEVQVDEVSIAGEDYSSPAEIPITVNLTEDGSWTVSQKYEEGLTDTQEGTLFDFIRTGQYTALDGTEYFEATTAYLEVPYVLNVDDQTTNLASGEELLGSDISDRVKENIEENKDYIVYRIDGLEGTVSENISSQIYKTLSNFNTSIDGDPSVNALPVELVLERSDREGSLAEVNVYNLSIEIEAASDPVEIHETYVDYTSINEDVSFLPVLSTEGEEITRIVIREDSLAPIKLFEYVSVDEEELAGIETGAAVSSDAILAGLRMEGTLGEHQTQEEDVVFRIVNLEAITSAEVDGPDFYALGNNDFETTFGLSTLRDSSVQISLKEFQDQSGIYQYTLTTVAADNGAPNQTRSHQVQISVERVADEIADDSFHVNYRREQDVGELDFYGTLGDQDGSESLRLEVDQLGGNKIRGEYTSSQKFNYHLDLSTTKDFDANLIVEETGLSDVYGDVAGGTNSDGYRNDYEISVKAHEFDSINHSIDLTQSSEHQQTINIVGGGKNPRGFLTGGASSYDILDFSQVDISQVDEKAIGVLIDLGEGLLIGNDYFETQSFSIGAKTVLYEVYQVEGEISGYYAFNPALNEFLAVSAEEGGLSFTIDNPTKVVRLEELEVVLTDLASENAVGEVSLQEADSEASGWSISQVLDHDKQEAFTLDFGGAVIEEFIGTEYDDFIYGGEVDLGYSVKLDGGVGHDQIEGGAGSEIIFGGQGSDVLAGGGGADLFVFKLENLTAGSTVGDKDEILDFEAGYDDLLFYTSGNKGDITIVGGGSEQLELVTDGGTITLSASWSVMDHSVNLSISGEDEQGNATELSSVVISQTDTAPPASLIINISDDYHADSDAQYEVIIT